MLWKLGSTWGCKLHKLTHSCYLGTIIEKKVIGAQILFYKKEDLFNYTVPKVNRGE